MFLMEKPFEEKAHVFFPNFYRSVIKSWKYFNFSRTEEVHYGISEPLFFNPLIKLPSNVSCFVQLFLRTVLSLAAQVKLKSLRTVDRIIKCIRDALPPTLHMT